MSKAHFGDIETFGFGDIKSFGFGDIKSFGFGDIAPSERLRNQLPKAIDGLKMVVKLKFDGVPPLPIPPFIRLYDAEIR